MLTLDEMFTSVVCGKLREVQRVRGEGGEAMPTKIVDVIEHARDGIEMKRKNATLFSRQTNLKAKLVEMRATWRTMRDRITATEARVKTLKGQLTDAQSAFEKLADDLSRT